ncbi:hypothetical protein B0H12DRAFT_1149225, partial [Mycena haematopus]
MSVAPGRSQLPSHTLRRARYIVRAAPSTDHSRIRRRTWYSIRQDATSQSTDNQSLYTFQ